MPGLVASGTSYINGKKPLIMINLGPALFDNNNRLITLSGRYKNLRYLNQFIVTNFTCINNNKFILKTGVLLPVVCLHLVVPETIAHTHNSSSLMNSKPPGKLVSTPELPGTPLPTNTVQ
jgi:hypothetical protein